MQNGEFCFLYIYFLCCFCSSVLSFNLTMLLSGNGLFYTRKLSPKVIPNKNQHHAYGKVIYSMRTFLHQI